APPLPELPVDDLRLGIGGITVGDPDGRLITLMPTATCADVVGEAGIADRCCLIRGHKVLGVLPESLTATLRKDAVDTVLARMPARSQALLLANLEQRYGAPDQRSSHALPEVDPFALPTSGTATLRWMREGIVMELRQHSDGTLLLGVRRQDERADGEDAGPSAAQPPIPQ